MNVFKARVIPILVLVLIEGCNSVTTSDKKSNFLIILADDAGYADFGFMGSADLQTPNIDRIADHGVYLTDAHTTASVCSPSRAGLLTGRYQQRFGHENNSPPHGFGMDPSETTIADLLKPNGYKTALFGKWHLGDTDEFHPNNRGFDEFWGFLGGHRSYFPDENYDKPGSHTAIQHNGNYTTFSGYLTDVLGDKTGAFIGQNKDHPWFAFLSFNAVHTPMQATEEDLLHFEGHPRQKLAAMTWAMDRAVGKVLTKLETEGIMENTMIFFFSDNGGPSSTNTSINLPLKSQKGYEFEGGHRVPFVIQYLQVVEGGGKFNALTSTFDVFPTIMNVAGIPESDGKALDGVDLLPFIKGEETGSPHEDLYWRIGPWSAARLNNYKLILAKNADTALYNLDVEIGEVSNLKGENPTDYQMMLDKLSNWEKGLIEPAWSGDQGWLNFKYFMYQDLIHNRKPRFNTRREVKNYLEENEK